MVLIFGLPVGSAEVDDVAGRLSLFLAVRDEASNNHESGEYGEASDAPYQSCQNLHEHRFLHLFFGAFPRDVLSIAPFLVDCNFCRE